MKKARRQYTREFKTEAVRLLETSGKSARQLERELGIGSAIYHAGNGSLQRMARMPFLATAVSLPSRNGSGNWSVRTRCCARSGTS